MSDRKKRISKLYGDLKRDINLQDILRSSTIPNHPRYGKMIPPPKKTSTERADCIAALNRLNDRFDVGCTDDEIVAFVDVVGKP